MIDLKNGLDMWRLGMTKVMMKILGRKNGLMRWRTRKI
jgi:hypothetical protein